MHQKILKWFNHPDVNVLRSRKSVRRSRKKSLKKSFRRSKKKSVRRSKKKSLRRSKKSLRRSRKLYGGVIVAGVDVGDIDDDWVRTPEEKIEIGREKEMNRWAEMLHESVDEIKKKYTPSVKNKLVINPEKANSSDGQIFSLRKTNPPPFDYSKFLKKTPEKKQYAQFSLTESPMEKVIKNKNYKKLSRDDKKILDHYIRGGEKIMYLDNYDQYFRLFEFLPYDMEIKLNE